MAKDNLVWEDAPTSDNFSWQIPPSVQKQRDNLAKKMIEDELAFDPSDPNQGALEQEYKQRFKATPPELEWEDAPLVWEDAPQPQEPMTKSEAFGRGFLNEALALSRFFGGDVDKTLKKSTDRKLEAAKEHPLTTGLGGLTTDVIAALPGIVSAVETPLFVSPLVSGLGGGWLAQGAVSGALSGSAIGGAQGTARYQEVLNQTGDEDAATKAAMSAGLTAQLGTALPPAFGGGLASRVGQGAAQNIGLNEIDVAIQNQLLSEYPESQLEQFSPANMALAGITGGIFGGLSSRKLDSSNISQKKIKEPKDLVDPNRNIGEELNKIFTDDLKSKEQDLNLKIDELYRDSVDGQLHPETQELLQQYLFELDNVKTKLARIEGKEVTAKGVMDEEAAFQKQMQDELEQQVREDPLVDVDPSGVTNPYFGVKRPDLINPLEDVKQGWQDMPTDGETAPKKPNENPIAKDKDTLDRLYMWQDKLTKMLEEELGKENTPVFNKQKIEELQDNLEAVMDNIKGLEEQIKEVNRGLKEPQFNKVGSLKEAIDKYPKPFGQLINQLRAGDISPTVFFSEYIRIASRYLDPGIHYINGSLRPKTLEFIKTLDNIFGISKNHKLIVTGFQEFPEDVRIKLESDPGITLGRNYETYQGTTLIYMSPGKWNDYLNRFPIVRKQIENLPPNIREDFSEMFVLAHEFGHNFLNRLKESKLLTDNALDKLFKAFESDKNLGMGKFQELTRIAPFSDMAPERFFKSYGNFHEWWANNFAKYALYSGNEYVGIKQFKGAPDWLRKELGKLSNMFGSLVSYFKRFFPKWNLSSNEVFKSFIQDYIQKNQESIQATGKHLLERHLVNYAKTGVLNNDVINFMDKFGRTNPNEYSGGVNNLDIDTPEIVDRKLQQNEPKDIGFISLKGLANYFGDSQFRTIFSDNPIITNMENIIKNAEYNAAKMFNDLWYGITDFEGWNRVKKGPIMALKKIVAENSPAKLMETISDKDLITVWNVIKQGFGKPYEDTLKTFGATLTPKQKEAFDILTKMFRQQYSSVVNHMDKLGKKSVLPFKDGWYPAVRKGDFYIELRNDVGDIIYREHFRTPEQANIFTRRFFNVTNSNRKGILISPVQKVAKEAHNTFAVDLSRIIAEEFQKTDPKAIEKVDILLDKMMVRGGKLGRHHQHRSNISGYMGSELFMSDRHMAESIRNAVKSSAEEYSGILRLMEIKTNSFKMIDTPSELVTLNYPNSLESAKLMRDMATNNVGSNIEGVDNFVRTVFDRAVAKVGKRLGKDFYPKVPVYDRVSGALGHIFYMFTLTSRPAVWIGQGLTSIFSLRHMLREENVFQAMRHAGDGILRMTNPDKDFANAVYWAADRGIFSPQFNNDLTRLPMTDGAGHNVLKTVVEYLSGEKFSAAGDTFSRYWTFATMYSMYKAKGLHGEKLLSTAADATDTTMVQYNRGHKAPMFQKAGIIGDQLSPLQTFAQANLANFVADARLLIKDPSFKNSAPLIATFLTTMLFAGAVGTPFLAEYEVLRRLLLWIDPDLDDILPDPIGSMMQGNDRTFSHGIISEATGYDIGSTMRWNPVISDVFQGREDFINMFPIIAATTKIGGAFATEISAAAGSDITDAQLREAMLNATPGGYKGLVDDLVFNADDRNFVPGGKRGFAKTEQTSEERIAKYLGTSTTETRRNDTVLYRQKQKEMKRNEQKTKYLDILSDGVEKGDSARINRAVTKLQELEVPWSEIWNNIQSTQGRRNIPELERQYTSPKGTTKSYNQMRRYEELQKALGE